ncbi:MAG: aldehyde dehydrogenase, partial [Alphaproteobacteria bacterium]|nr:aldehyde dehydrogenase [Alphaproteobacteria bacterium]
KKFKTINPATEQVIVEIAECDKEDVDVAVKAARKSFDSGVWSRMLPQDRKVILLRLADLMEKHHEEFALLDTLDMGKAISFSYNDDLPGSVATIRWYAEAVDKIYDEISPTPLQNALAMIRRQPVGVVGAVVPWNFPLMMACWKMGPSLAAGNSVVLKPAEQSPLSALLFAKLASEAGLPDGVLNVITGYGETCGKAIGLHNDINVVAFTGSTEVGKYFLQYAGQSNMKSVWLECGGKSPNLIFADSDLEAAADNAARGIWYNQGEVCSANSRLLVENKVKDKFIAMLNERAKAYQPCDPLDPQSLMGAVVDATQHKRILSYIDSGKQSAKLVLGGNAAKIDGKGYFIEPTMFSDVKNDMKIAQEEIFGPVLSVMGFNEDSEAVKIANNSIYGLAASVWTGSLSRAHRLSDELEAGTVTVNGVDAGGVTVPFGGFKQSGFGRDLSLHSFDKYMALKTVWINY